MFQVQAPALNETRESDSSSIYLTGSAQMHLESLALGLSKVNKTHTFYFVTF